MNTDSVATLGEAASSFFIVYRCFLPSAYARTFMSPFKISFTDISDDTAYALCFLVSLVASTGAKFYRTCSCVSSFVTDASPNYFNLLSPFLGHIVS